MEIAIRFTVPEPVMKWGKWMLAFVAFAAVTASAVGTTGGPGARPVEGAFLGGNGSIAFQSNRDGDREVFVMDDDGSSQTNLTNNAILDAVPAWSPDGKQIAFRAEATAINNDVFVMNANGSGRTNLTNTAGFDNHPAWSPDGTQIAFRSDRDGNHEIYSMNANGSSQTRLTNDAALDSAPAWSPDGTKILFTSDRDGNTEIYVMNADGSGETNLTNDPAEDSGPAWSPDGTQIAFSSDRDGNTEIYVMNADGSGETNLTNDPAEDAGPAWSPDGTQIAFTSGRDGNNEIYVMDANGSNQTNLTNNGASETSPDWQPIPQIHITNLGQYALPKSCFEVQDSGQMPLFTVCDNDFQGAPASHVACDNGIDTVCNDEDPTLGVVTVAVDPADYNVVVTEVPFQHTADPAVRPCSVEVTCTITFASEPDMDPWYPWDLDGNGTVNIPEILAMGIHFGDSPK